MRTVVLFNKPFNVLSQFTDERHPGEARVTLSDYIGTTGVYPAGRLDRDSEGLLILTDSGPLQHKLTDPVNKVSKTYWAQVEGTANDELLQPLRDGIELKDGLTRPAKAQCMAAPDLWPRTPPIRTRKSVPTSWIELSIQEGRNRQVRRMCAAVGLPVLRLVRYRVGSWTLDGLNPGDSRVIALS